MKMIFASLLVVAACGSDPLDPGAGSDPGGGTRTLFVDGHATAEPSFSNAKLETDFTTEFSVRIRLADQDVRTGSVIVMSRFGEAELAWTDGDGGRWVGTMASYDEVYRLDIVSGSDEVLGVTVDGPDIHQFTAPLPGATLDSTADNPVTWSRDSSAQITTFEADEIDRINITDTGDYMMGAGVLKAERERALENRLEIRRTNHIVPGGAIDGSDFAVSVAQRIDVLAAPNPAL